MQQQAHQLTKRDAKLRPLPEASVVTDFVKAEKNLASLGFFTPSSKRIRGTKKKTISFTQTVAGKKVEARASILPSAEYGLPVTADQDKYLALQKIITDRRSHGEGKIGNPIGFTSAELLRVLGKCVRTGKNYDDIAEWLKRMTLTGVSSEGVVFFAGRHLWASDTFHVFERAVVYGAELPDGAIANKNYVWLSEWQLENLNNNYVLPVDLETYKRLKNHIAKALVPLLQIWLYATRQHGSFRMRYDKLCQILNIRQYGHASRIREKLSPSLDELTVHGYLAQWGLEGTSKHEHYKIIFYHGEKFHRDRRHRLAQKQQIALPAPPKPARERDDTQAPHPAQGLDAAVLKELTKRAIPAAQARTLSQHCAPNQRLMDQLEYGDAAIQQGGITNPVGFYLWLIKTNYQVPDSFETSRKRHLRQEAASARQQERQERARLELAYDAYREHEIDKHLATLPQGHYQQLLAAKQTELTPKFSAFATRQPAAFATVVASALRSDLTSEIPFTTLATFCQVKRKARRE